MRSRIKLGLYDDQRLLADSWTAYGITCDSALAESETEDVAPIASDRADKPRAPGGWPDDYIVATGESHSVEEFAAAAFAAAGIGDRQSLAETGRYSPDHWMLLRCAVKSPSPAITSGFRPTMTFEQIVHAMAAHELEIGS